MGLLSSEATKKHLGEFYQGTSVGAGSPRGLINQRRTYPAPPSLPPLFFFAAFCQSLHFSAVCTLQQKNCTPLVICDHLEINKFISKTILPLKLEHFPSPIGFEYYIGKGIYNKYYFKNYYYY
jgi:hypothetical protein